jgi:hypothetical protein
MFRLYSNPSKGKLDKHNHSARHLWLERLESRSVLSVLPIAPTLGVPLAAPAHDEGLAPPVSITHEHGAAVLASPSALQAQAADEAAFAAIQPNALASGPADALFTQLADERSPDDACDAAPALNDAVFHDLGVNV